MKSESEKISIIVPVYKVEKELPRCVESLRKQTYRNIEIILVDDGSPDRCPEICDTYAGRDCRVIVIHKENGGLSDARNTGLRKASGTYIMYVDSDDYIELDSCERLIAAMESDVDMVVGACKKITNNKIIIERRKYLKEGKKYSARDFAILSIKNNELYTYACINLYNKNFLIYNKLFFEKGYLFEDTQLLPTIIEKARVIKYIDYPFYNYMVRKESITASANNDEKKEMIIKVYGEWYSKVYKYRDMRLKRYMYGSMIFQYLWNCRAFSIDGWYSPEFGFGFALRYAIGIKEKLKVILFTLFPKWYINISV